MSAELNPEHKQSGPTADELLQKVQQSKYPPEQLAELSSQVELLQFAQSFAKIDVNGLAADTWARLPEIRRERAAEIDERIRRGGIPKEEKERLQKQADSLRRSAEKLSAPDVDEQFKARAFATEFAIRTASRIRGIHKDIPALPPDLQENLRDGFSRYVSVLVDDQLSRNKKPNEHDKHEAKRIAEKDAGMLLLEHIRQASKEGQNVEAGITSFLKTVSPEINPEPGHRHDVSLDEILGQENDDHDASGEASLKAMPESLIEPDSTALSAAEREEHSEAARRAQEAREASIAFRLHQAALVALNPREYAIYHVLLDNAHVLDFRINQETQKLSVKKKAREGIEKGVTPAKLVREALPEIYSGDGAAYRAIDQTVSRLSEALRSGPVELDEAAERRQQMTSEERRKAALDFKKETSKANQPNREPGTGSKYRKVKGKGSDKGDELE